MKLTSIIVLLAILLTGTIAYAEQETCPQTGEWTKIDSDDLSLYPVPGATEYCFKAGSDNSQGCIGGLFDSWPQPDGTCGLSHWSYRIPTPEPTSVPPTPTPTERPPDPTPEFTPTPTDEPNENPEPSKTPKKTQAPTSIPMGCTTEETEKRLPSTGSGGSRKLYK